MMAACNDAMLEPAPVLTEGVLSPVLMSVSMLNKLRGKCYFKVMLEI